ncbi:MAG TPA: amidohydrolase family protein [Pyrinomonadaceae bacterium]|jgi:cytosine/adenosine deaminase-related metal-dependent hydrolase|nr:amidohydrolase family protein [Pyrinomonadaceae bacterium]
MTKIYSARWVLPVSAAAIENGAVAVVGQRIAGVGPEAEIVAKFPSAKIESLGDAVILPGLINTHTHLELTALRGYLEKEENDFFAWLRKLTVARLERMTPDDIHVSATWGACEAVRAGVTCVADASDSGLQSMLALQEVGLRGVVFQESFGPDARLARENFEKLKIKVSELRGHENDLVRAGVSPHAPYTVCAPQLELIVDLALSEGFTLMMHAAESEAEELLLREGCGAFAEGLARRSIEWKAPGMSTIQYLKQVGILDTQPLLAHCIRVDDNDIETLRETECAVAHCPKSNAKLGHGRAPLAKFIEAGVLVGLGSDSVASNNTCDILEEARFATLLARAGGAHVSAEDALRTATFGGELREGLKADLIGVRLTGVHQTPGYDPVATLIFASSGQDVILTVIDGREVYRDGRVTTVDEDRLRARMKEILSHG